MSARGSHSNKVGNDRNLRIRQRLFPGAETLVFNNASGGYVSFPILLRKLLRYMKPTELELLAYLWLRSDMHGLCFPTVEEIADELGQQSTSRIRKTVRQLQTSRFISTRVDKGRTYFLVHDPRHAVVQLYKQGTVGDGELEDINELLAKLKLPLISKPST